VATSQTVAVTSQLVTTSRPHEPARWLIGSGKVSWFWLGILDYQLSGVPFMQISKLAGRGWALDHASARPLAVDPQSRCVRATISSVRPDRAGDVVLPGGLLNRDDFLRNPVVLWNHDRRLPPIGTCEQLSVFEDRIEAHTRFVSGWAWAENLFALYAQGVLRGWSIGFVPRRVRALSRGQGQRGLLIEQWELLEYSAVVVPENADALTLRGTPAN
jgi:hypothetical protein